MSKIKIISVLVLFTMLCGALFADAKKDRQKIDDWLADYKELVELAEVAAKEESWPKMAKVEAKMAGVQARFPFLKINKQFTQKDMDKYNEYVKRYGKAHAKFAKEVTSDDDKKK